MSAYSSVREKKVLEHVASVALGLEALEAILVEQGVLREGQLMEKIEQLAKQKAKDSINLAVAARSQAQPIRFPSAREILKKQKGQSAQPPDDYDEKQD